MSHRGIDYWQLMVVGEGVSFLLVVQSLKNDHGPVINLPLVLMKAALIKLGGSHTKET